MSTASYISWHIHEREQPASERIRVTTTNFNTWATGLLGADDNEITFFMHSANSARAMASKLAELSHRLFIIANEMDIVSQAKKQAGLVG